jgi:hypothetical protein
LGNIRNKVKELIGGSMKKAMIITLLLSVLFMTTQTADAKMSVISPSDMIDISDYIIVGKIKKNITTKKQYSDYTAIHREVTFSIEVVLKGEIVQKEIVISRDTRTDIMNLTGISFEFPKKGTTVMLLLRNYTNGISITYANSICVIKKGKIHLYEGMGFGSNDVNWSPQDYEETYQAFYDKALTK